MNGRTTLVVGATGMLGSEVCRQLRALGRPVRGLVRDGSVGEDVVRGLGVEIVRGDLKDAGSLRAACAGMGAVVSTANSILRRRRGDTVWSVDRDGHLSLIAAARTAGVTRFVYLSLTPRIGATTPFVRCKRRVESEVRASGMAWTILQPGPFMEVVLSPRAGWDLDRGRVSVIGSGTVAQSYISLVDVAQYAVLALERPILERRDVVLGGPEGVTPLQAVREFEAVTGRSFAVRHLPVPVVRLVGLMTRPFDACFSSEMGMALEASTRPQVIDMGPVLEAARPPRPLTTVRDYARRVMGEGDRAHLAATATR